MTQMGLRAAMAFALLGLGGAAMVPGFGVYDIVALAGGSVAAGGIFALERRRYMESRSRVALAPERFLDLLAVRQQRRTTEAIGPRSDGVSAASPSERRCRQPVFVDGIARLPRSRGGRDSCSSCRPARAPSPARRGTSDPC